jgi:pilus assembly protein CpaC
MSFAQTAPARELPLVVGRGELLQFDSDIKTVAASEPKIADAVVVSPREVMINAKGVGKATVVVWEQGAIPRRYNVSVLPDATDFDTLRKTVWESVGESTVTVTGNTETLVLTGSAKTNDASKRAEAIASTHAKKVINLIQTPHAPDPREILLEVKFASIDRTALSEIGVNLFSRNSTMLGQTSTQQFAAPRFSQLQFQDQNFSNSTLNFSDLLNLFVFRPDLNIGATIRAMQTRNLLQILAEPNLIALEGKDASFLAGGEFPFPTLTATSTGGATAPVVTVQFKKFGIQLDFTPTILHSGSIHLRVRPQVSSLDYDNAVTLQGYLIPALATRVAETEAVLKDGESFAIAGLIDNRVIQSMSKVKWLGDVPILGQLFKSRSTKKSNNELLVVITPHFVRPLGADEKAKLPEMPESFLPPLKDDQPYKKMMEKKAAKDEKAKPEFIGPKGHQEPK